MTKNIMLWTILTTFLSQAPAYSGWIQRVNPDDPNSWQCKMFFEPQSKYQQKESSVTCTRTEGFTEETGTNHCTCNRYRTPWPPETQNSKEG